MINNHIFHGFIANVYEPFVAYEGTEWGDQMRALHDAYSMGEEYAGFSGTDLEAIETILRNALNYAYEDGLLDGSNYNNHFYTTSFREAKEQYKATRDYWKSRALSFHAVDSFELAEERIPDWIKSV